MAEESEKLTMEAFKELKAEMMKNSTFAEASMGVQHEMLSAEFKQQRLLKRADARDAKKVKDDENKAKAERANEQRNIELLASLKGFAKAGMKMRLTAAKLKKVAGAKIKDWGAAKIATVKKAAVSLLDFLQKGLGLAALWALFWFIKKQPWKAISEEVKKNIGIIVDGIMGIGAWIGVAKFQKWLKGTKTFVWLAEKFAKISNWFKNSWIGKLIDKLKTFFDPKKSKILTKIGAGISNIGAQAAKFGTSVANFFSKFFTPKGKGGGMLTKLIGIFNSIGGFFSKSKVIAKVMNFVKGAGKFLGRIFLPFTVLMSLWEAVSGFMDGFANTEGNMVQKIIGGIGGAVKSLLDFFVFGIADMVQSAIVWLLELFGFDSAATAVGDFNLVGMIRDAVFAAIDFVTDMWKWVAGGFAGDSPFKGLMSWFDENVWQPVVGFFTGMWTWASEGITAGWNGLVGYISGVWADVKDWFLEIFSFAAGEDTDSSDDGFLMSTIKKVITSIKAWFGKMFDFSSAEGILASVINVMTFLPNLIKDAIASVTEWLLGLFGFDDAAKAVANANKFSIGEMVMNAIKGVVEWLEKLFDIDIGMILSNVMGALGDAGKKVLGWLGFGDDAEKGKTGASGNIVSAKEPILVGEHGPELFVPSASGKILPKMQTENAMAGAGGAPMIINAPSTANVSNGSTAVSISSTSINPMNEKYFRN